MKKRYSLLVFILFNICLYAQLPNTDIWLLDIKTTNDSIILSNPVNITNRDGYDNQPAFSADGKYILYTSIRDSKQSDVFKYNLTTKSITQITNTPTSEYSPTFIPDEKKVSVVTVEQDSTQRVWSLPIDGGKSSVLIKNVDSVGYHTWLNNTALFMFLLPEPFKLYLVDRKTGTKIFINDSIGRCFKNYQEMLLYVKKSENNINKLWLYNLSGQKSWSTKTTIEGEDFTIINNDIMWTHDSKIYLSSIYNDNRKLLIDLANYNIKNITRISFDFLNDKIAIVAESKWR